MYKKEQRGQAVVIMAIGIVVLLIFAALAIDAGNAFTAKREAQNAADAAALAGTRQMLIECSGLNAPNEANILDQVTTMSGANVKTSGSSPVQAFYVTEDGSRLSDDPLPLGATPCGCSNTSARGVEVSVTAQRQSFFAGLIGQQATSVHASAKARYAPAVTNGEGVYPFTRRHDASFQPGQIVTLRVLDNADTMPGSFGWLTWDGSPSADTLQASLEAPGNVQNYVNPHDPNDGELNVGDWVQAATGNMNSGPIRARLDWHIANQTVMVIPLYDAVENQGANGNYRVASFAGFNLLSYDLTGQEKSMTGKFVRWVTNGNWVQASCEESGLFSVKLTP